LDQDERVYENLALELLHLFKNELQNEDRQFLEMVVSYRKNFKNKVKLILSIRIKTRKFSKNLLILGRLLLNHY